MMLFSNRFLYLIFCLPIVANAIPINTKLQDQAVILKDEIVKAINDKSESDLLEKIHPQAVIVLENTQTFHSRAQLKDFLSNPIILGNVKVTDFHIDKMDVNEQITVLDKNTFIATGSAWYKYEIRKHKTFVIPVRWVATLTQEKDKWLVVSYQNTVNLLDNPSTDDIRQTFYFICLIAFLIGLIIGFVWKKVKR